MSLKGVVFLQIWSFEFFRFFSDFNLILIYFIFYFKSQKEVLSTRIARCHGAGPARMRRGMQGHVAEPREPTRVPR